MKKNIILLVIFVVFIVSAILISSNSDSIVSWLFEGITNLIKFNLFS